METIINELVSITGKSGNEIIGEAKAKIKAVKIAQLNKELIKHLKGNKTEEATETETEKPRKLKKVKIIIPTTQ